MHPISRLSAALMALAAVAWAQPAPLTGLEDSATFVLYKNEDALATIRCKLSPNGAFERDAVLTIAGQTLRTTMRITPDAEGRWATILLEAPQGVTRTTRDGASARRTFENKTEIVTIKPGAVLFDNLGPALMSQPVRLYNRVKGGRQTFPLVIAPGAAFEGSLEFKDSVERAIRGKDVRFDRFTYGVPGVDITVWAGPDGKIYFADVPAQRAAYVREGYELLRQTGDADPLLSAAKYELQFDRNVMVAMRDGVKLATDVYLPRTEGKFPAILVRTPYKKEMAELQARFYARRGYAVAVQDCRGRFGSGGVWEPFVNEPKDGYDAVEWLAKQPWSTGKVGMIGGSYVGWVQWWAARERPPHLLTIIPNVAPPDPFFNIPYENGVFFIWGSMWWADVLESNATADLSGVALSKIGDKKYGQLLRPLPVVELDKTILGKVNPYWRKWIEHPVNDAWWEQASFLDRLKDVRIPVFHQSGWFDGDGIGTKLNYLRMKEYGHPYQKLIVGPWGHTDTAMRMIGDRDFGPNAIIDLSREYLRWFDYWLKGVENGIVKEPLVRVFVMGSNRWLTADAYPLPATNFQKWYLASRGGANTSNGDGSLTPAEPAPASAADKYVYDPGDPTPNPDFYETTEEQDKQVRSADDKKKEREARHVKVTSERPDILVYTTEPLKEPLTFAGPVSAVLYAASSARDTDWFMSLSELDKDGKPFPLCAGRIRARFRSGAKAPQLLKPGEIYEYRLDLWHTGITIPAGHRLRVEVASASFPWFSRNLNTGGHNETETKYVKAGQIIYHDAKRPSHVLLPVIPAAAVDRQP